VDHVLGNAARCPQSIAVVSSAGSMTWDDLASRVDSGARQIRQTPLPPAALVGVPVGRDAASFVQILALSRAGLTPFPFDRDQPPTRASAQLRSAGTWGVLEDGRVTPTAGTVDPGVPAAYVLATSGSTGQPKAVSVPNDAIGRYESGLLERLGNVDQLSALLLYPLCVDIGLTGVIAALATGGTLHILSEDDVRQPGSVRHYVDDNDVALLKITPSHLFALQQGDATAAVPQRFLILGGEPPPSEFVRRLVEANPGCALYNHYGPSETAVGVSMHRLGSLENAASPVSLGDPLDGIDIAIGAGSELLIRVREVGLGYASGPRETARRFIPDAAPGALPGGRAFRSGDEVVLDESGRPVFVARFDDQVKLRAHRIDLGEIDAALRSIEGVEDAAAAVDAQRLVAVVVSNTALVSQTVIEELRDLLPEPMIPAAVAVTPAVPRGRSGKIDRVRVAELARSELVAPPKSAGDRQEAGDLVDQILAILADTLGSDDLTADADFFEHGGDSLLAMTALWQIRLETGVEVTLANLIKGRSAEGLTRLLSSGT
jgi:non-ribosomal peptide synthetase component F